MAKGKARERENAIRLATALDSLRYSEEGLRVIRTLAMWLHYMPEQLLEDIEDLEKYVRKGNRNATHR